MPVLRTVTVGVAENLEPLKNRLCRKTMKAYFHNSRTKTLFIAPTNPNVTQRTDRQGATITTVSVYIEAHCFDGRNGSQMRNMSYPAKDSYTSRDSQEQAVSYFKRSNYPSGELITGVEYLDLYKRYESELKAM